MDAVDVEGPLRLVLLGWVVIVAAAWVFGGLARRVGQPRVVGEILGGILLGPSALGLLWPRAMTFLFPPAALPPLELLGKIGLLFLLFQVGMELEIGHLRSRSRSVLAVGLAGIVVPALAALAIGPWLHRAFAPAVPALGFQLFLCIGFSISALPVLARILIELDLGRTPVGTLALSAAALEDAIGWVLLAAATALVSARFAGSAMALQVAGLLAFAAVVLRLLGPGLGRAWRWSRARAGGGDVIAPSFLALLIVALLACSLATDLLGIFSIFGAFLLGVSLRRETELARVWRERYSGLVLVALVPIFFTSSGLRTRVGELTTPSAWLACGVVIAAAALGKLAGCYLAARATGEPPRFAAAAAVLMNTRGLMELVALNVGLELGLLSPQVFTMMVLMALATTCMTTPLVRRLLPAVPAPASEPVVAGSSSALAQ